jgi:hypothetical protein
MSPIDPRELTPVLSPQGTFEAGFLCVKCNYDLTGLPRATVCPECGTPNARPLYDKKRGTGVSRAPIAYVNRLGTWLWAASFALIATWLTGALAGGLPHPVTFGIRFVAGLAWIGAIWMATHPKPDRFEPGSKDAFDDKRFRIATIVGQSLWLLAIALDTLAWFPAMASAEPALRIAANLVATAAAAGFIPLGIMLASLANWMGDTEAESRCQTASWLIAFYGLGLLLAPVIIAVVPIFFVLYLVFWLAYLVGVIMLAMSLFALARAANWAVQNARHKSVVSGRRAVIERERSDEAGVKLQERLDALDNRDPTTRAGRRAIPKDVPVPKSHIIERRDDTNPYDIDDD